jgi:excisionase family DNA binding protein
MRLSELSGKYLSTAQVAQALGVGVSTVKRWVDEGLLPAERTPGGHRKLYFSDVMRLVRSGRLPGIDVSVLGVGKVPSTSTLSLKLFEALRRGDSSRVQRLVVGAYRSGLAIETLADEVVAPAMHRIGHDWVEGRLDVYEEHRGTQAISAALFALKALVNRSALRHRPLALGAAPEGDWTLLPSLLAELILLDLGWQVVNLGPNTPWESLAKAIGELQPKLVWVSASHCPDAAGLPGRLQALIRQVQRLGGTVILGGRGFPPEVKAQFPAELFGERLSDLARLARTLHPLPAPPRRGRPPRSLRRSLL